MVNSFTITGLPASATHGTAQTFTVTAYDKYGNVDTLDTDTVGFTSNDATAILPPRHTFTTGTGADNGKHTFSVTLNVIGFDWVGVYDIENNTSIKKRAITVT